MPRATVVLLRDEEEIYRLEDADLEFWMPVTAVNVDGICYTWQDYLKTKGLMIFSCNEKEKVINVRVVSELESYRFQ